MRYDRLIAACCAVLLFGFTVGSDTAAAQEDGVEVNWAEGTWTFATPDVDAEISRITFAGDWRPARVYTSLFRQDPEAPYGDMLPVLRESDLRLVNVETTIGNKGTPIPKGGPTFQSGTEFLSGLTRVPFDVAILANNHAADYGPPSIQETIDNLRTSGIRPVGAGMKGEEASRPLFLDVNGTSVAVIACAEGEEGRSVRGGPGVNGMDVHKQVSQIRRLQGMVDVVLVSFHGGREYLPSPPPYVTYAMRSFAEAGADAIIAHHPHVPQSIEVVAGVPIVYSQGNFIFWQEGDYYRKIGYLVHLDIADDELVELSITPYRQTEEGLVHLEDPHREELMDDLEQLSLRLQEEGGPDALWEAYIDRVGTGTDQLRSIADGIDEGDRQSAEYLYNLYFTSAHRELFLSRMQRVLNDEMGTSPQWARQWIDQWLDRPASELPE
jgi:poly-gamma-glutamate synthesis protein (capsule biosynthesis protein)